MHSWLFPRVDLRRLLNLQLQISLIPRLRNGIPALWSF